MKHFTLILGLALASTAGAQDTHLVVHVKADRAVALLGESVRWEIWAELFNPTGVISATVSDMAFSLDFGGQPELSISDNAWNPAFNSVFFGPANPGTVSDDRIDGASGTNTLPPLNNPGGPDSSNPLFCYGFTMNHDASFSNQYTPSLTIHGQFSGAYVGSPFHQVFFYQSASGGTVPFRVVYDTISYIPAPATGTLALLSLAAIRRRSR